MRAGLLIGGAAPGLNGRPFPVTASRVAAGIGAALVRGHLGMQRSSLALLLTTVALTGCTTFGGSVKGSFACKAPNGTCAPMGSIDSQAVNGLGAAAATLEGAGTSGTRIFYAGIGDAEPVRTSDRVLKIVFPAHTDGSGIYRDEAVARVVVERGEWMPAPATVAARTPKGELAAASQAQAYAGTLKTGSRVADAMAQASGTPAPLPSNAVGAPSGLREVAASLEAAPMPQLEDGKPMSGFNDVAVGSAGAPTAGAIAAARAGHRIGQPQSVSLRKGSLSRRKGARSTRQLNQAQLSVLQASSSAAPPQRSERSQMSTRAPAKGSDVDAGAPFAGTDRMSASGAAGSGDGVEPR